MKATIRKRGKKWYLFVTDQGHRYARSIGSSEQLAELVFGDRTKSPVPLFDDYAHKWLRQYAEIECKPSTVAGYRSVLESRLVSVFGKLRLDQITRNQVKDCLADLAKAGLSRNTLRNTLCTLRGILNHAIEDGLIDRNPASRLGRFTKAGSSTFEASALTHQECKAFLKSTKEVCPDYYALFLTALRTGLRRGELVALRWGDIKFGNNDEDPNRYILVRHNYVHRKFTSPKSKKPRRVDLSRQLQAVLLEVRHRRMLAAFASGKTSITDEFVFPSPEGSVLDPDNLVKRYFLPTIEHAGLRRFRFHDLRLRTAAS